MQNMMHATQLDHAFALAHLNTDAHKATFAHAGRLVNPVSAYAPLNSSVELCNTQQQAHVLPYSSRACFSIAWCAGNTQRCAHNTGMCTSLRVTQGLPLMPGKIHGMYNLLQPTALLPIGQRAVLTLMTFSQNACARGLAAG
jgi:hypothetical protein